MSSESTYRNSSPEASTWDRNDPTDTFIASPDKPEQVDQERDPSNYTYPHPPLRHLSPSIPPHLHPRNPLPEYRIRNTEHYPDTDPQTTQPHPNRRKPMSFRPQNNR
ncbi:uncharacterized protein K444DRAFT_619096 [Hyaloscypha bicolor E]|uniref:Uncharacterized protein n=1 Tax=Hyaloscypha bicolor E TaxID=1095630 RepID=A0A2J6SS54_9HELO|nr:uncharacterized protein K444DRAFT_619096 [Hyaloscypha bicolor E]PMD53569.1 hypothetical protein K444DRAFT_619096 [Hyaloscypha bicolor E]